MTQLITDTPKNILYIEDVMEVTPSDKKSYSFTIKLRGGKNLVLKAISEDEANKWTTSIRQVADLFCGKMFNDVDPNRMWKNKKIDPNVCNVVMEEVERSLKSYIEEHIEEFKDQLDYSEVLATKKLAEFYNSFKEHTRTTRFMFGYVEYNCTAYEKESPVMASPGMAYLPPSLLGWTKYFCFMITSKSYVWSNLTELEEHQNDLRLLRLNQLLPWMEFDTMYLFKYDGPNDDSDFVEKVQIKYTSLSREMPYWSRPFQQGLSSRR